MAKYLQYIGEQGINVTLSSVNYGSDTQVNWLFSLDEEEREKTTTLTLSAEHQQTEIEYLQEVVVSLQQQVNSLTERVTVLEESS